jgi:hypothetical protein
MSEAKPRTPPADSMICRSCGREERASEGYPCARCGTFICLICNFRGVTTCQSCSETPAAAEGTTE